MDEQDAKRIGCLFIIFASIILWGILILLGWGFVEIVQWITSK